MDAFDFEELSNEELSQLIQRAHDVYQKRMEGVMYSKGVMIARDSVVPQRMATIISTPGKSVTLDLSPYHCMLLRSYLKWCKFIELPASCNYNARCQGVTQPLVLTIGDIYFDQVMEIDQDDFAKNFQRELEWFLMY